MGLVLLIAAGLWAGNAKPQAAIAVDAMTTPRVDLALVFVLYAFGGWSHAAYVAAEVRDQRRNLPRALLLGIASITLIYLAVNATYVSVLGFEGARRTPTLAADVLEHAWGTTGGQAISLLVMLSALGAINAMILTGTRIYAVWGADYPALAWLGVWNRRTVAPISAIAVQAAIALLLILCVGTAVGRDACDLALQAVGLPAIPWEAYFGGFETLVAGSTPVFWALSLLTGLALFLLRRQDRSVQRPFSAPLYPLPPLIFCGTCAYMLYASVAYARWLVLLGLVPLAIGGMLGVVIRPGDAKGESERP
jgi:amino acid transporter